LQTFRSGIALSGAVQNIAKVCGRLADLLSGPLTIPTPEIARLPPGLSRAAPVESAYFSPYPHKKAIKGTIATLSGAFAFGEKPAALSGQL